MHQSISIIPPRPNVREPSVWSWPVQQLVGSASYDASSSMADEYASNNSDHSGLDTHLSMNEKISTDPKTKREFYERAVHSIAKERPSDGWSDNGPPIDRAEAKLRIWLNLFGHNKRRR